MDEKCSISYLLLIKAIRTPLVPRSIPSTSGALDDINDLFMILV
ncbi:hypothetical protein EV06_0452 [Prochlorococcus sp. MIT 0602]|nr:hypothetical protein EV06_0452 [Prochlorococcus sp. MIT 0602]KGG18418.1 hypothetical protein EV07_0334 [Prochlorococcus sp. MIT 0603]